MRRCKKLWVGVVSVFLFCGLTCGPLEAVSGYQGGGEEILLPEPRTKSAVSIEEALKARRSVRAYKTEPLSLQEVSQVLWSAQGVTSKIGFRTAPSAGIVYPLRLYIAVGEVEGLEAGIYRYVPKQHALVFIKKGDVRRDLSMAAKKQPWVEKAPCVLVLAAGYEKTRKKYGEKAELFVHMETGHAVQNVYLQSESLGLGTVVIGALESAAVGKIISLPNEESCLCMMAIGRK